MYVDFKPFLLIAPLSTFKIINSTSRKEIILALFTVVPKVSPFSFMDTKWGNPNPICK